MHLESRTNYLVLHDDIDGRGRQVHVVDDLAAAVRGWTSGSRLSPIWSIRGYDTSPDRFSGTQKLLFLGPVQPARLMTSVKGLSESRACGVWVTSGCFSVVVRAAGDEVGNELVDRLLEWSRSEDIAYECWRLEDGLIREVSYYGLPSDAARPIVTKLADMVSRNTAAILRPAFQENVVVTATSLSRAAAVYPPMFAKLSAVAEAAGITVQKHQDGKLSVLEMQSHLLSMNAALSRFSSQAFSGIPPIQSTECHFWIHSLLGTGTANLALSNLVEFVQNVLGEARIRERLTLLENHRDGVPTKEEMVRDPKLLDFDLMGQTDDTAISKSPIVPLITYFSGRDGFSSQLETLSAPLTTLAECNSYRSNLLTVTHEISHIFVRSALTALSPTLGEDRDFVVARKIARPGFVPTNHLEAARQLLIEGVITMDIARTNLSEDQTEARLPELFERWRSEVQEILVHTFDFLYFHQGDPKFYVTSIWHSWCSIPGISERVPEYLMRTLCSVAAKLLENGTKTLFDASVASTRDLLEQMRPSVDPGSNYVGLALDRLNRMAAEPELERQMRRDFAARIYLVRLVRIYLFSDLLAAQLFADDHVRSRSEGGEKKRLTYNTTPIGNGLNFLRRQLKENPSEAESLWVLHCLAFDLRSRPGAAK
jgi:hypothetical protein